MIYRQIDTLAAFRMILHLFIVQSAGVLVARGGGGGTAIYGLYRYVPWDRVQFLRFSVLK